MTRILTAPIIIAAAITTARADTLVISPGADIQEAVNLLDHGDVLQLEPGTYHPSATIQLGLKAIEIIGSVDKNGQPTTIIDGRSEMRIFRWGVAGDTNGKTPEAGHSMRITNLVLTGGNAAGHGGALSSANPESPFPWGNPFWDLTIRNCVFKDNQATLGGGALHIDGPGSLIINCMFINNQCHGIGHGGGAVFEYQSQVTYRNCLFDGNAANGPGGAVRDLMGFGDYESCAFERNTATGDGGAISHDSRFGSFAYVNACRFEGNHAGGNGGHLHAQQMMGFIHSSQFSRGSAMASGGAVSLTMTMAPDIDRCEFTDNHAMFGGGGAMFFADAMSPNSEVRIHVNNCDFNGNSAPVGGAILDLAAHMLVSDTTFVGNLANDGRGGACHHHQSRTMHRDCEFTHNESAVSGGALFMSQPGPASEIRGCVLTHNLAPIGGGIYIIGDGLTIRKSTICSNSTDQVAPNNTHVDGGGNAISANCDCPADITNDGFVNAADLGLLLGAWGWSEPAADIDGNGTVNAEDLGLLLSLWGGCP